MDEVEPAHGHQDDAPPQVERVVEPKVHGGEFHLDVPVGLVALGAAVFNLEFGGHAEPVRDLGIEERDEAFLVESRLRITIPCAPVVTFRERKVDVTTEDGFRSLDKGSGVDGPSTLQAATTREFRGRIGLTVLWCRPWSARKPPFWPAAPAAAPQLPPPVAAVVVAVGLTILQTFCVSVSFGRE